MTFEKLIERLEQKGTLNAAFSVEILKLWLSGEDYSSCMDSKSIVFGFVYGLFGMGFITEEERDELRELIFR